MNRTEIISTEVRANQNHSDVCFCNIYDAFPYINYPKETNLTNLYPRNKACLTFDFIIETVSITIVFGNLFATLEFTVQRCTLRRRSNGMIISDINRNITYVTGPSEP